MAWARLAACLPRADLTALHRVREARPDPRIQTDTKADDAAARALRMVDADLALVDACRKSAPYADPTVRDADGCARAATKRLYAPYGAAQDALRQARERHEQAMASRRWWHPASWREAAEAAGALASAHAYAETLRPCRSDVDDAQHLARVHATNAAKAHAEWQAQHGQLLDRTADRLLAVRAAVVEGDPEMLRAVLDGDVAAAMRVQAGRDARRTEERDGTAEEWPGPTPGNVVPFRRAEAALAPAG